MHTGRLWRSFFRRDLRFFGRDWDYFPKRQAQRGSIGFIFGADPSEFDFIESEPGELRSDGAGIIWRWHIVFTAAEWNITFDWAIPAVETKEHGTVVVTFERVDAGDVLTITADIDDIIEHDGDYRHFRLTDENSEMEAFSGPPVDPPWSYDFWPWTYQDEPSEDT